jgi:hypothetical protein
MGDADEAGEHLEVEASRGVAEGSGFHPPASVAIACLMVGTGTGVLIVGTPIIRLPGGISLSDGMLLVKGLLGLMILAAGVGLYTLQPWARKAVIGLIFAGGILVPLYGWESNLLQLDFIEKLKRQIDWEFAWTLRGLLFVTSAVVLGYLRRPSVAWALEHGGVPARFEAYVCAGCNQQVQEVPEEGCEICGGPLFEQFRSAGGVAYLRELEAS